MFLFSLLLVIDVVIDIMLTCPCNVDPPLQLSLYSRNWGLQGGFNVYPQSMF